MRPRQITVRFSSLAPSVYLRELDHASPIKDCPKNERRHFIPVVYHTVDIGGTLLCELFALTFKGQPTVALWLLTASLSAPPTRTTKRLTGLNNSYQSFEAVASTSDWSRCSLVPNIRAFSWQRLQRKMSHQSRTRGVKRLRPHGGQYRAASSLNDGKRRIS